jgi:flagellar hook-associated protein 3 FlgL
MRISDNQNYGTLRENIFRSKERMDNLQSEASTMKKLNTPSDDPVGAAKVLEVRTEKMNNDQYQTNAKMAESFLTNSEQALTELSDLIVRAKEIAISQSSGASANSDTRLGVAEEVTQLYNQAVAAGSEIAIFSVDTKRRIHQLILLVVTAVTTVRRWSKSQKTFFFP